MPPLPGFSDSPIQTREDLAQAGKAFLRPILPYFSPECSRVRIPVTSGTLYDEAAAQLEGFARPLWVVGSLLMSNQPDEEFTARLIRGLSAGTDPDHEEYWGDISDMDQRMVEAETISFTLLASPAAHLWDKLSEKTKANVATWFLGLNGKQMPVVNWLWFRVFTNLVLIRVCKVDNPEIRSQMKQDFSILDSFYLQDGWSSDGKWRGPELDDREWELYQETGKVHSIKPDRCVDYYSGSFAIQFGQLLYLRFAGDMDPERTARYQQQARDFGAQVWRYFDSQGAAIPFGRSLTYRFACGAFFAALALAKVPDMPHPLNSLGAIRGFLLRHLRWWAQNSSDIFYTDGTLNFGWVYPNMYLTEDYNSPQSVYWALKSFIALGLPTDDPFWTDPEGAYPHSSSLSVALLPAPRHIMCNRPNASHHFLLSAGQFTSLYWKGGPAKYCKFAYSSAFGFSVPTAQATLQQLAPDNMLALSRDGTQTWATKWKCNEPILGECQVHGVKAEKLPIATVEWYPWDDRSVKVTTTLVPPSDRWPDWHVRIHKIRANSGNHRWIHTAEGGFAISGRCRKNGMPLPKVEHIGLLNQNTVGQAEGVLQNDKGVLVLSQAGASGLVVDCTDHKTVPIELSALQPEANTNLMAPRTLIPVAKSSVKDMEEGAEFTLISKIFAIAKTGQESHDLDIKSVWERWVDQPSLIYDDSKVPEVDCIII